MSKQKENKIIKIKCPYCGRKTDAKQDVFFTDVYFCVKCNEEIHISEVKI